MKYYALFFLLVLEMVVFPAHAGQENASPTVLSNDQIIAVLKSEGAALRSIGVLKFCGSLEQPRLKRLKTQIINDLLNLGALPNNRSQRVNQAFRAVQIYIHGITDGLHLAAVTKEAKESFCSIGAPAAKSMLEDETS